MFKKKKFPVGYDKLDKRKTKKNSKYLSNLLVSRELKTSIFEKFTKLIIYICLRLVIPKRHWYNEKKSYTVIDNAYKKLTSADTVFIPSSIAFYLLMAFIPVTTIIFYVFEIPIFSELIIQNGDTNFLITFMSRIIPGIDKLIGEVVTTVKDGDAAITFATISFLLISTWISASGFAKLIYTQSHVFEHKFLKVFWLIKLKGILMVFAFATLTFILIVPLAAIDKWLTGYADASQLTRLAANGLSISFQILILLIWTFSIIALLFKYSPKFKIKFKNILPGTIVTSIPIFVFLSLFSYITSLWSYDRYAIFGAVMYISMAMFLISYFIFIGINVNAAYYKTFVNKKLVSKWSFKE